MARTTFFTPGPAELYPTFEKHLQTALNEQLGSISHRSQKFRDIYKFTVEQLRQLMTIPTSHGIFLLGSASEIWERVLLNCVEHESFHLVNGSFSRKFYDYALGLNKFAHLQEKPFGEGFDSADVIVPEYAELICTTHNETSSGVQMPENEIHKLKKRNPSKLIAVDMVSSAPYPALDYKLVDTAFFSVQKSFGLPAGLGVWIANEKCLEKAQSLKKNPDMTIGAHHDLPTLWKNYEKYETPSTPNVMLLYVLGKVAEDMNRIGIERIRKETHEKATTLYSFLQNSSVFSAFVTEQRHQSKTVIVANSTKPSAGVIAAIKKAGMIVGSGYGSLKDSQLRIANFPALSVEQVEKLIVELGKVS